MIYEPRKLFARTSVHLYYRLLEAKRTACSLEPISITSLMDNQNSGTTRKIRIGNKKGFETRIRNPPQARVRGGQKLSTEVIQIILQTSVRLFQISSQKKKSFLTTPNVEKKFWSSYETLKSTGEMNLMMTCYLCLHNFSEL